jgi:hypothetical protein
MSYRRGLVGTILLIIASLGACTAPQGEEVVGASGSKYTVIGLIVLTVGNGDRALVVKYRGSAKDIPRAVASARDLAPVFQPEVVRQRCQGLVMTAVEDTFRLGGFSTSKTYAVVFMLNADGTWSEVPPK